MDDESIKSHFHKNIGSELFLSTKTYLRIQGILLERFDSLWGIKDGRLSKVFFFLFRLKRANDENLISSQEIEFFSSFLEFLHSEYKHEIKLNGNLIEGCFRNFGSQNLFALKTEG